MSVIYVLSVDDDTDARIAGIIDRHPTLQQLCADGAPLDTLLEQILLAGCQALERELPSKDLPALGAP